MIIVIDGPAGSGKSSTAKEIAKRSGIQFLDSGAFYRALTLLYIENNCQKNLFFDSLKSTSLTFTFENNRFRVYKDKLEVTDEIRSKEVSEKVSEVAAIPEAREFVNENLREYVKQGNFIADGRDLGTVVFPDADHKFFLIADINKRAERRLAEMKSSGQITDIDQVEKNLKERDYKDSNRDVAPLSKASDAIEIDTSNISFEEQVTLIMQRIGL